MGRTSGSRTVTMPVAVMPEYATGAGGPGATLHSSSFTPIANSPACTYRTRPFPCGLWRELRPG